MPGRVHEHEGAKVYHRADGALTYHGRKHARYMLALDKKHHASKRPEKQGYPHAGDGRPMHKGKNKRIHRKKGRRKHKR